MKCIRHYIKAIYFTSFDFSSWLFGCYGFGLLWMVFTHSVSLLNWCWILMLRVHLKILINLIRCFKLLLITNVFNCGALKLYLHCNIFSLSQIFIRFRIQHRKFVKDDIFPENDLSFRWRPNSESFDSIFIAHKESLPGSGL